MTIVDQLHHRVAIVEPQTGVVTPFFLRFLTQLWLRTGGNDDAIEQLENDELYEVGMTDSSLVEINKQFMDLALEYDSRSPDARISVIEKKLCDIETEFYSQSPDSRIEILESKLNDIETEVACSPAWQTINVDDYQLISTGTAYTTTQKQLLIVTSNVTITLNAKPKDKEDVIIKRNTTAGTVTIDAGAKTVDGAATYDLVTNYEGVHCVYSYTDDAWFII